MENGRPFYQVAKKLAEACSNSSVLRKAELVTNKIGYLIEEIFKQNAQGAAWFLSAAYSIMQEQRNDLKTELWVKREAEFK